jgi:hypothetical protein
LPNAVSSKSKPVLFADDASIIITNSRSIYHKIKISQTFKNINDWFKSNLLTLNFDKTYFIECLTKKRHPMDIHINYDSNQIVNSTNTKFLGLTIDNMLSWKGHADWLMSKLGSACYAIRTVKPYMAQGTIFIQLRLMVWISVVTPPHSIHIFRLQKRAIRIITDSRSRDLCRELFKKMKILPLQSQYRKGQSELLLTLGVEIHVGNYLRKWKCCPFNHSTYFLFCCS